MKWVKIDTLGGWRRRTELAEGEAIETDIWPASDRDGWRAATYFISERGSAHTQLLNDKPVRFGLVTVAANKNHAAVLRRFIDEAAQRSQSHLCPECGR